MTELDPLYTENGCVSAQSDRQGNSSLVCTEGVAPTIGGELEVTQRGAGANMSVDVASGNAFIQGTESAWQGMYHVSADATENIVIAANGSADPRIDIIVATVRDSQYSGAFDDWILQRVAGTPSPSPSPPATPDNSYVLAQVAVAAGASSITNANITDTRGFYELCTGSGVLLDILVYTGGGSFAKTDYPTIAHVEVEVQGSGGGGGGASNTNNSFGAGGGSGGYCKGIVLEAALSATETVTVGNGGAGGVGNASGSNGATSSFGAHIVCAGGQGGAEDAGTNVALGGNSGNITASPADAVEIEGQDGETAWGNADLLHSGVGANSGLGLGGQGRTFETGLPVSGDGRPGTGYGSGGGGAHNGTVGPQNGGDGADGIVIVRVYG